MADSSSPEARKSSRQIKPRSKLSPRMRGKSHSPAKQAKNATLVRVALKMAAQNADDATAAFAPAASVIVAAPAAVAEPAIDTDNAAEAVSTSNNAALQPAAAAAMPARKRKLSASRGAASTKIKSTFRRLITRTKLLPGAKRQRKAVPIVAAAAPASATASSSSGAKRYRIKKRQRVQVVAQSPEHSVVPEPEPDPAPQDDAASQASQNTEASIAVAAPTAAGLAALAAQEFHISDSQVELGSDYQAQVAQSMHTGDTRSDQIEVEAEFALELDFPQLAPPSQQPSAPASITSAQTGDDFFDARRRADLVLPDWTDPAFSFPDVSAIPELDDDTAAAQQPAADSTAAATEAAAAVPAKAVGSETDSPDQVARFSGEELKERRERRRIATLFVAAVTPEMAIDLWTDGDGSLPTFSPERKLRMLRRYLINNYKKGKLASMLRALRFWLAFAADEGIAPYPAPAEALQFAGFEYRTVAQQRATAAAAKRAAQNLPARRNDRGGVTALKPLVSAWESIHSDLSLKFKVGKGLKKLQRYSAAQPTLARMTNLDWQRAFERATHDPSLNEQEQAYAGAASLMLPAGARTMDFQRTGALELETTTILGTEVNLVSSVARLSKAREMLQMQPLEWRAPILPLEIKPDLEPLIRSMTDPEHGCMFRAYTVQQGAAHAICQANGWAAEAAEHCAIVRDLRSILVKMGIDPAAAEQFGGHSSRHVLPEIGRVMLLPKASRETLANHAVTPVFADDAADRKQYARAVRNARIRMGRTGRLASQADRYSSELAEPVISDEARVVCLLAAQHAVHTWASEGAAPKSSLEQIRWISEHRNDELAARAAQPARARPVAKRKRASGAQAGKRRRAPTPEAASEAAA